MFTLPGTVHCDQMHETMELTGQFSLRLQNTLISKYRNKWIYVTGSGKKAILEQATIVEI